jgi:protein-S-isoprenylcysteine O-methyltransferase Ste14
VLQLTGVAALFERLQLNAIRQVAQSAQEARVFVLIRATLYATGFIALLLVLIPSQLLARSGITRPPQVGVPEVFGAAMAVVGAIVALWCILTFVVLGRGTPAPFDPPRRLVVRGPYRYVRNPMYLGAGLALAGAAAVYHSLLLLGYLAVLAVLTQGLVVWYEEPALTRSFGTDYASYREHVNRWLPWWPRTRSQRAS